MEAGKIKQEVFQFYKNKFHEHRTSRTKLMNPLFSSLPLEKANNIEAPITRDEVMGVVWLVEVTKPRAQMVSPSNL